MVEGARRTKGTLNQNGVCRAPDTMGCDQLGWWGNKATELAAEGGGAGMCPSAMDGITTLSDLVINRQTVKATKNNVVARYGLVDAITSSLLKEGEELGHVKSSACVVLATVASGMGSREGGFER